MTPLGTCAAGGASERLEAALATIESTAQDHAFTDVWPAQARGDAYGLDARVRAGEQPGPLYGAVVAVKDIMAVRGRSVTGGTRALNLPTARHDAEVVQRLKGAGAVVVGATNLHALAFGPFSTSSDAGVVVNPLNPDVVAGGSSGGSAAAVATGAVDLALGSDTAGSVRIPSAVCAVTGLKGTFGATSMAGVQPLAPSLDHVGPIARTVSDLAVAWAVLCGTGMENTTPLGPGGPDEAAPLSGVVVGDPGDAVRDGVDAPVLEAFEDALTLVQQRGGRIRPVALPDLCDVPDILRCTIGPEAAATHRVLLRQRADLLPRDVRLRLQEGAAVPAGDYRQAQQRRSQLRDQVSVALDAVDVLLLPTLPVAAPLVRRVQASDRDIGALRSALSRFTALANLTGHPALTLPWARDPRGCGIGVQLVGPHHGEQHLLSVAGRLEHAHHG